MSRTEIVSVEAMIVWIGRPYVTVKIVTGDGHVGYADATVNGFESVMVELINGWARSNLLGKDSERIEEIWNFMYRAPYWSPGTHMSAVQSAIDVALWDIKGKRYGVPVYQLLGGAARRGVLLYKHANGETIPAVIDAVKRFRQQGFLAVRVQCKVPGSDHSYGVGGEGQGGCYEPAHPGARSVCEPYNMEAFIRFVPKMVAAVREACGDDFHLCLDCHHRPTPIEAACLLKQLEPFRMWFVEDVIEGDNFEGLRLCRKHAATPIAMGEIVPHLQEVRQMIGEQLVDYVRLSVTHGGGITGLVKKVAPFAEAYKVGLVCHGAADLSPIAKHAHSQLLIALPNGGGLEWMDHMCPEEVDRVFRGSLSVKDGLLTPSDKPGLGIDYDEEAAAVFPMREPVFLPHAVRQEDGRPSHW